MTNDDAPDATSDMTVRRVTPVVPSGSVTGDTVPFDEPVAAGTERYQFLEEIARGGMGAVHLARDLVFDRDVGVKTLLVVPPEGSVVAARFREEARITGQLQHPNIPPVHDLGALPDGRPYLAMKLIKGRTLEAILKARPDPSHERGKYLAVFEQIAQGVAYAHAHQVIHRDLKPLNVMVGAFGEVQVMDWGLAKIFADKPAPGEGALAVETGTATDIRVARNEGDETRAGSVFGTPAYMPREQAIGAIDQIDARSDVFSLGGVLCAILTGKPPYIGSDSESTRQLAAVAKLGDAFVRLDSCGAEPELIALCKRCLAPERDDRPRDAGEVAQAVADLRAEAERRARQAELDRVRADGERAKAELQTAEQRKRRKVQLAFAGAVLLLVTGAGAAALWKQRLDEDARLKSARFETDLARQETTRVRAEIEANERRRELDERRNQNRQATERLIAQAEKALLADDPAGATVALDEAEQRFREGGAESLDDRLKLRRADLATLLELERLDELWMISVDGKVVGKAAIRAAYAALFKRLEIVPGRTSPEAAARQISSALLRERLLGAMEFWLLETSSVELGEILLVADPDPYRCQVRIAVATQDDAGFRALIARPDALAQPARFSRGIGHFRHTPPARREAILRAAHHRQPDNFFLLIALGYLHGANGDRMSHELMGASARAQQATERIAWYRAAIAIRPTNAAVWNNLGNALRDRGEYAPAVAAFEKALALEPNFLEVRGNLALTLIEQGDKDAAVAAAQAAVALDPKRAFAHECMGNALNAKGDYLGAERAYRAAIACDPSWATGHYNLSAVLLGRGDYPEGLRAAQEAVRLAPNMAPAHLNVGVGLEWRGDIDGALAAYRTAIKLVPAYATAHLNLGYMLRKKGDFAGEVAAYREVFRVDPQFATKSSLKGKLLNAYLDLGRARLADDIDGAVGAFREAINLDRKHAEAWGRLGTALLKKGDTDGAAYSLLESIALDPKREQAWHDLGCVRAVQENWDAARAACQEALKLNPKYARAYATLGFARIQKGDLDDGISACREALRCDPEHANAHATLGIGLFRKNDLDGAIAAFRTAIRLDPKSAIVHANLGSALAQKGDTLGSIAAFRESLKLNPKDAGVHNDLGVALYGQGELGAAAGAFREAIKLDPKDATAHANLGAALLRTRDFAGAVAAYREAIKLDPTAPDNHAKLGEAYVGNGDSGAAVMSYREALRLNPKQPKVKNALDELLRKSAPVAPPPREVRRP